MPDLPIANYPPQPSPAPTRNPKDIALAIFRAYETHDRDLAESLIADDFTFTSSMDNELNRETYFRVCWPNHEPIEKFEIEYAVADGNKVFVIYEGSTADKKFRNCEKHTIRGDKIASIEVYFGWDIPHRVPYGQHSERRDH